MKEILVKNSLKEMNLKLGSSIIMHGNDIDVVKGVFSSGSIQLDRALGVGGFPYGRIVEIFGNETSGKTTIALQTIKAAQDNNKKCLFIDAEHALDIEYVKSMGIDISKLLVASPMSGEQVFEIIEMMINEKKVDLIVVDSVAAMVPSIEMESNINDQQMGAHARLMSKGLRKIQTLQSNTDITIIFLNQIREKIGVFFGNPETTTGGKALRFYSSIRIEARKAELIKESNEKIGIKTKLTIIKSKVSPPLKIAYVDIFFGKGFDYNNEILDFAIEKGIIIKSGSWYSYNDNKIGQGKEQLKKYFIENENIFEEIKTKTLLKIN